MQRETNFKLNDVDLGQFFSVVFLVKVKKI